MFKSFLLAAPMVLALSFPVKAATFVLDFTGSGGVPDTYGDNGFADISYRAITHGAWGDVATTGGLSFWTTGYGDLDGAIWGNPDPSHAEIRIQALDPLALVTLNSFDMGGWIADEAAEWRLFDLAWNPLGTGTGIAPDTMRLSFAPGLSAAGGLIFQWGLDAWDVGVENFSYSVSSAAVPLPPAGALLLGGLGLFAIRRRKSA